MFKNFHKSL